MRNPALILCVDDTPENLEILQVRLEANGYEVALAVDGEDGLEKARALKPDLILLDVMMPKLDGIAMVKELKADPTMRGIPGADRVEVTATGKFVRDLEHRDDIPGAPIKK